MNSLNHEKIKEKPQQKHDSKCESYCPVAVRIDYRNFDKFEEVLSEKMEKIR